MAPTTRDTAKQLRIPPEAHKKLLELAEAHHRYPVQEIGLLIEEAYAKWKMEQNHE